LAGIGIVEKLPDNRLLVRAMLGSHYDLEDYAHGLDALAGLMKNKPGLVLL